MFVRLTKTPRARTVYTTGVEMVTTDTAGPDVMLVPFREVFASPEAAEAQACRLIGELVEDGWTKA